MRKAILFSSLCLMVCLRSGAQDRSTPEATVRTFLSAISRADLKQAAACVKGVQMSQGAMDVLAQDMRKDPASFTLVDPKTTINGSSATVTGTVEIKSARVEKTEKAPTSVSLVSSGSDWLIVPDVAKARQDKSPDLVNAVAYVLTDPKVLTQARDSARGVACLSNVKQLCLGAMMFAQDYDERFKLNPDAYKKSLMPYVRNEGIFKCPADSSGSASYAFNANLAGINIEKIHAPAQTVLIYEGRNGKLAFRHDGKAAVGFADGHAKLIDAEGAKKLRWKP